MTGEVHYPRAEHDAALHLEGTGEMVWGTKFVLIAARHPHPHSRFIVDVAHVPTSGGEAATAVNIKVMLPHFCALDRVNIKVSTKVGELHWWRYWCGVMPAWSRNAMEKWALLA